jgi:hypothetical protein
MTPELFDKAAQFGFPALVLLGVMVGILKYLLPVIVKQQVKEIKKLRAAVVNNSIIVLSYHTSLVRFHSSLYGLHVDVDDDGESTKNLKDLMDQNLKAIEECKEVLERACDECKEDIK